MKLSFEQEIIKNSFKLVEISLKVGIVYTFITILYHKIIIVFND
jgi:hypothetical protein